VEQVNWDDAVEFCGKLNAQESLPSGYHYALPTEAQWEYACRAGTTTPFHFGSTLNGTEANCSGSFPYGTEIKGARLQQTSIVGSYPPNAWGLHDMHGNVWEWCADWFGGRHVGGTDPTGSATGEDRVHRGGTWRTDATSCRAATRGRSPPGSRYGDYGFYAYLGCRPALVPSR
jgi:formylglycine-generating enzyme required for sulfatase activity